MIEYVKGEITELTPALAVVECGGVGYGLNISLNTYSAFNGKQEGKFYVYEVIREDAHLLYGFVDKEERNLFLLLISVSGVGPNFARTILSSMTPGELVNAIVTKNEAMLTAVKGIGAKTAQRILVDLKNKVKAVEDSPNASGITPLVANTGFIAEEAIAALVMLGFQKAASQKAVLSILKATPTLTVEQVIKSALRML